MFQIYFYKNHFREGLLPINISIVLDTVLKIDEVDEIFYVSFILLSKVSLTNPSLPPPPPQWTDPRLTYNNLKTKSDLNVLTPEQQSSIWSPQVSMLYGYG